MTTRPFTPTDDDRLATLVHDAEVLHGTVDVPAEHWLFDMWTVCCEAMEVAAEDPAVPQRLRQAFARIVWDTTPEAAAAGAN